MRQTIGPGIFVSFAVGSGVGAVAGLFFAPKRREQLREEITQEAADGLDQVRSASGKVLRIGQVAKLMAQRRQRKGL